MSSGTTVDAVEKLSIGELFTSEKHGDGTELKPFKTILQAINHAGKEPFPVIYVDSKAEGNKFKPAPKTQLKKNQKFWVREHHKSVEKARNKNLEEAKKIDII